MSGGFGLGTSRRGGCIFICLVCASRSPREGVGVTGQFRHCMTCLLWRPVLIPDDATQKNGAALGVAPFNFLQKTLVEKS